MKANADNFAKNFISSRFWNQSQMGSKDGQFDVHVNESSTIEDSTNAKDDQRCSNKSNENKAGWFG